MISNTQIAMCLLLLFNLLCIVNLLGSEIEQWRLAIVIRNIDHALLTLIVSF